MIRALVNNATTVMVSIVVIFVFGLLAYVTLPRESAPDIKIPFVIVSTPYLGVAPADVEGLVTIPIERELASLTDVKRMSSSSAEGVSVIAIEFEPEADLGESLQQVRDRVNRAKADLPPDAEDPSVTEVSFSDIPILLVTLAGAVDEQLLKEIAQDLQDEVTRIPGVLDADVTGGREREIRVEVQPDRLSHYGLSMNDVVSAIQGENVNIPGGDVTSGRASFLLRTPGEFTDPHQLDGVAIKRVGDVPVFVSDVARVSDTFEERLTYSRMRGAPSVTLSVKKRTGSNMLELSDQVRALVAEQAATWPAGVTYAVLGDQSENVRSMVLDLQNNIITALLLVVGVILVFMGLRNSLFVALSIPLSMLASMLVLQGLGFTLNMVVLFSLILALGMLVDNAIVVVENVYRHLEMGKDRATASVDGTNEVAVAVTASTATTVAAFFPMVFWTGIMGQFMGFLPKTVIIVLMASLLVALLILPVLTSRFMAVPVRAADALVDDESLPVDPGTLGSVMGRYHALLALAIQRRYLVLLLGIASLVGTLAAYGALNHGIEFFPATEPERATVAVRLPEGADLEATDSVVRAVESVLAEIDNLDTWVAEVGVAGSGSPLEGSSEASNQARITVDFLPAHDKAEPGEEPRVENTFLTLVKLRHAFSRIPGAEITVEPAEMGPPVGDPIAVQVSGDDFNRVGEAAALLLRELEGIEGTTDLKTDYRVGRPELRLRVDRGAAKRVGVSTRDVGNAVRTAIAGAKASALRDGDEEYDIVVELAPEYRDDLQQILALRVPGREDTSPKTFPVPLSAVASYELAGGAGTIKHVDQDLVVTITGDVVRKDEEAMVRQRITDFLEGWQAPAGIEVSMGGAADEQAAASAFLAWAFGLAVALIIMVLVTQFDSLAIPAIIMFTVVLSLVGVLWGLVLTGTAFGIIMTGIGVISLAGVVVNNAIVLLDYVQQLRAKGMGTRDALLRAGVTRFRPVMLTAVTTALGLLPMAIGASIDFTKLTMTLGSSSAQFWGPMAVAVIFGLSFATVLTLVMVPTLFAIYEDAQALVARVLARFGRAQAAQATKALVIGAVGAGLLAASEARAVGLDDVLSAAEDHNVQLRLARESTVQARTLPWQAISSVLPSVSMGASFVINQDEFSFPSGDTSFALPDDFDPTTLPAPFDEVFGSLEGLLAGFSTPTIIQPKTQWQGNLTLRQPLLNGQAFPAWQGAKRVLWAAMADEERVRQQVRGAAARAYYGLASARKAVEVSETNVQLSRSQLELAQRRVAAGSADELSAMQAEIGVLRAQRNLLDAQASLAEAEEGFQRAVGLPGTVPLDAPPPVDVGLALDEAQQVAQADRTDVEAAGYRIEAAQKERTARDLGWLPSLDFTFTETYNSVPGFVPENFQWRIAFGLNWTIWDGGMRIARSRELASKTRQARIAQDDLQARIHQEVRVGFERLKRAELALETVEAEASLAERTLERAEARAGVGRASWLDVDVARTQVQSARLAVVTERMNRDLAAVDLLVAMGRFGG